MTIESQRGRHYPHISVVIVNFNGKRHLEECLESLFNVDYPSNKLEVIVVDNGSKDGSVESITAKFPHVRVVQLKKNLGFCLPNNIGARLASGDYVFFLNNDTVVERSTLKELAKAIQRYDDSVAAFAPKILYYDNRRIINVAGATLSIIGFGFYIGDGDVDSKAYSNEKYVGFACGAAALLKRDVFLRLGGFDPEYFASAEEAELGFKIWLSGKKVIYVPSARVYHKVSATFGKRGPTPLKVYLQTRNRLLNMFKFIRPHRLLLGFLLSIGLDLERFIHHIIQKKSFCAFSILYAYIDAIRIINKKSFKLKRSIWQSTKINGRFLEKMKVISSIPECIRREVYLWRLLKNRFFSKEPK
jgi:GT2 family glycosyltransferase